MHLDCEIARMPGGKYSVLGETPEGPFVGEGLTVEGVIRILSLAVVDGLAECVDLDDLQRWGSDE